jgi:hypothetical protein
MWASADWAHYTLFPKFVHKKSTNKRVYSTTKKERREEEKQEKKNKEEEEEYRLNSKCDLPHQVVSSLNCNEFLLYTVLY